MAETLARPGAPPAIGWQVLPAQALPIGPLGLAWTADGRLAGSQLPARDAVATAALMRRRFGAAPAWPQGADLPAPVQAWIARLRAVMNGSSGAAGANDLLDDIPLADDTHTPFHRRVWALARQIAPGHTRSYGELAQALGEPGAARAVGQALGANPFAPFVPCHRVLAKAQGAGGFSAPGGTRSKLQLLQLEGARFEGSAGQKSLF